MKRTLLILLLLLFCSTSVAFGYIIGGSNFGFSGYPDFNPFISYNPSKADVESIVAEAKTYVENGNYDIQRIRRAQNDAIQKANDAVANYNRNH